MGDRGDGQYWEQYSQALETAGYTCLMQVADEGHHESGAKDLAILCDGMPIGTAQLLAEYVIMDCNKILKEEKKNHKSKWD